MVLLGRSSPTGKPVAPHSFAASLRERRDLVERHHNHNPDHKGSGLKQRLAAVGVKDASSHTPRRHLTWNAKRAMRLAGTGYEPLKRPIPSTIKEMRPGSCLQGGDLFTNSKPWLGLKSACGGQLATSDVVISVSNLCKAPSVYIGKKVMIALAGANTQHLVSLTWKSADRKD